MTALLETKVQLFSPSEQNKGSEKGRADSSSAESSTGSAATSSQSLPSFWIPSLTPEAKPTLLKKPVSDFFCHVRSGQWLLILGQQMSFNIQKGIDKRREKTLPEHCYVLLVAGWSYHLSESVTRSDMHL